MDFVELFNTEAQGCCYLGRSPTCYFSGSTHGNSVFSEINVWGKDSSSVGHKVSLTRPRCVTHSQGGTCKNVCVGWVLLQVNDSVGRAGSRHRHSRRVSRAHLPLGGPVRGKSQNVFFFYSFQNHFKM